LPVQGWRSQWWCFLADISPASPALPTTAAVRWGSVSLYLILTWDTPCPVPLAVRAVSSASPDISNCWERMFIADMRDSEPRSLSFSQEVCCALSLAVVQGLCWRKEEVIARGCLVLPVAMSSAGTACRGLIWESASLPVELLGRAQSTPAWSQQTRGLWEPDGRVLTLAP